MAFQVFSNKFIAIFWIKKYRFQFFVSFIKQNDCQTSHPRDKELNCNVQPTGQLLNTGFQPLVVKQQDELQCEFKRPWYSVSSQLSVNTTHRRLTSLSSGHLFECNRGDQDRVSTRSKPANFKQIFFNPHRSVFIPGFIDKRQNTQRYIINGCQFGSSTH